MTIFERLKEQANKPLGFQDIYLKEIVGALQKGYSLSDDLEQLLSINGCSTVQELPPKTRRLSGNAYAVVRKSDGGFERIDPRTMSFVKVEANRKASLYPSEDEVSRIAQVYFVEM